jgi:ubiquinone/menaquinone biosynthesis C-methylase UbiE
LEKSIRAFPKGTRFADELAAAGFADVAAEPLLLGVAHLFVGVAP